MEAHWEDSAKHPLPNVPRPSEPKRKESRLVGNEERSLFARQCCQCSSLLAKSGDSDFVKRLATFSGVFGFSADLEMNVKARIMSSSLFSKALPGSQAPSSLPQHS